MKVTRISDWDLEERIAGDPRAIVVMFVKTGERTQEILREEFRHLASSYADARFYEVDLLENPSLVRKYSLSKNSSLPKLPVTLVFVDGVERARHIGSLLVGTVERILGPQSEPEPEEDEL